MKKLLFGFGFLLLSATSCKKSDPQTDPVFPASRFSATLNGKTFIGSLNNAYVGGGHASVSGTRNEGTSKSETISLNIRNYVTLASYPIDSSTDAAYDGPSGSFQAKSGAISISTVNDTHVAGTFAFEAMTSGGAVASVTNGSFDIYY